MNRPAGKLPAKPGRPKPPKLPKGRPAKAPLVVRPREAEMFAPVVERAEIPAADEAAGEERKECHWPSRAASVELTLERNGRAPVDGR